MDNTRKKRYIIASMLFLFFTSIIVFLLLKSPTTSPIITERSWTVQTFQAERKSYHPEIILYGKIDSPQQSTLASTLKATVTAVPVREGEQVKKGDLLIALDDEEYALIVQQRQAQIQRLHALIKTEIEQQKADLKTLEHLQALVKANQRIMERFEQLEKKQHASKAQIDDNLKALLQQQINLRAQELAITNHPHRIDQLQADLASTKTQLQQARIDRQEARIRAPFTGRITAVLVAVGDDVADNQKLISLYNLNDVELRAQIPSQYIPSLNNNADNPTIYAILQDYPQYKLPLIRSGASLNTGDASIDVFFKVPFKLAQSLPLGLTIVMRLILPKQADLIRIPASALYSGNRIYQVKNERLHAHPVQRIGEQYDSNGHYYLIKAPDLPEQAFILKTKLPNVRNGLKVNTL